MPRAPPLAPCPGLQHRRDNAQLAARAFEAGLRALQVPSIYRNESLASIDLGSLERLDRLDLRGNTALTDVALGSLQTVDSLFVIGNTQLSTAELKNVRSFESVFVENADGPSVLRAALDRGAADVLMFPVGPVVDARYTDEILPLAKQKGVGSVCFKTFGAGKLLGDSSGYGRPPAERPRAFARSLAPSWTTCAIARPLRCKAKGTAGGTHESHELQREERQTEAF